MDKKSAIYLVTVSIIVYLLIASSYSWWPYRHEEGDQANILSQNSSEETEMMSDDCGETRVIAREQETGDLGSFPNKCEVLPGWEILGEEGDNALTLSNQESSQQALPRESGDAFIRSETGQVVGVAVEPPRTGSDLSFPLLLAGFTTLAIFFKRTKFS